MTNLTFRIILSFVFLFTVVRTVHSQSSEVHLNGVCPDGSIDVIKIVKPGSFWWRDYFNDLVATSARADDNTFALSFAPPDSQLLNLSILGQTWTIYVSPGDSVNFSLTKKEDGRYQFAFGGDNAAHYNYFQALEHLSNGVIYKGNLDLFKQQVDSVYEADLAFTRDYVKTNSVSEHFTLFAFSELKYWRVFNLYHPVQKGYVRVRNLPQGYLNGIDDSTFDHAELLGSPRFREALVSKYIYCFTDDPWINFESTLANIKKTFRSKVKDYLITAAIGIYAKKQNSVYSAALLKAIDDAKNTLSDPVFLQHISVSKNEYMLINRPLPEEVLDETILVHLQDRTLSLRQLLALYNDRIIYVDFWASWCSACRVDIAGSSNAKKYLKDEGAVYLYISLDKFSDIGKWKSASSKDHILDNQFLLKDDFDSPLAKFLAIDFLPRYVILDKNHLVKVTDAARPTDAQLSQLKASIGALKRRVVTFK